MWIKNTSGKKDAMLTFATIAFLVATANVLLSTIGSLSTGSFDISFQPLDAAIMSTYLGVAFSAYVGRRWTDRKYIDGVGPGEGLGLLEEEPEEIDLDEVEEGKPGEAPPEPPPSLS